MHMFWYESRGMECRMCLGVFPTEPFAGEHDGIHTLRVSPLCVVICVIRGEGWYEEIPTTETFQKCMAVGRQQITRCNTDPPGSRHCRNFRVFSSLCTTSDYKMFQ
jgi:hypothetical protein